MTVSRPSDDDFKQLLDEVFVTIQNNQGRGKKPKAEAKNSYWDTERKKKKKKSHDRKHSLVNLAASTNMIILRNHAPRSYMTWLPVTLSVQFNSVLDMIIV